MNKSSPFSVRLDTDNEKRLYEVVAATSGEVSKSEVVNIALALLFRQLEVCPSMVPGYDALLDKSVTHDGTMSHI